MKLGRLILTTALSTAVVACSAVVQQASAADYTMKIGFVTFKDQQHEYSNMYKAALEKATNGRIEVKVFPRGQLGAIPRQIEGVQLGTIEAFVSPTDFYVGVDPRYGVFSIPTLFKDKAHSAKVLADADLNKEILQLGGDKGMESVAVFPHSMAHYFAKDPIRSIADFKGKKLRINATPAERLKMSRLGATGVPMPLGEVLPSLQRGAIDGTMSGMVIYVVFKYNKIGTVVTQTDDTMIISQAHVSQKWLAGLPADLRKTVVEVGKGLQPKITAFSMEKGAAYNAAWAKMGGSLHKVPDADIAKMRELLKDVGEEVTKDNPKLNAFYKRVKAVAAKY
jgi:TRAP-type C4-dicarboxylate transport system substrate-binding protein